MPQFRLLGPLEAWADSPQEAAPLELGGRLQRATLARLLIARGQVVTADRLVHDLWPGDPSPGANGILQTYIYRLRRVLEPGRGRRTPATLLVRTGAGYALRASVEQVDAWQFEAFVREHDLEEPEAEWHRLERALSLWRGPPLAELTGLPWAEAAAGRLEELRLVAAERRAEAVLRLGRAVEAVADLETQAAEHPLREESWRLLALALYQCGRQGEALAALRRARTTLREELGVEPGEALRRLESDILRQTDVLRQTARLENAAAESPGKPIRVAIVDDQPVVRTGLCAVFQGTPGFAVAGEACDGEEAVTMILDARPDVVLMDIVMPRLDGLAAARRVLAAPEPPKVVMLTTFGDEDHLYRALQVGASGFVLKSAEPHRLVAAVRAAAKGDTLIDPVTTTRLVAKSARSSGRSLSGAPIAPPPTELTAREREVLRQVALGRSNQEIAAVLEFSESAVRQRLVEIRAKLGLRDRAQMVVYAYESSLVRAPDLESRPLPPQ